jgi:hypothetical protein
MKTVKINDESLSSLRMRNVSGNSCRKNQNIHFISNNFFPENRTVYETKWKNMVQAGMLQTTV